MEQLLERSHPVQLKRRPTRPGGIGLAAFAAAALSLLATACQTTPGEAMIWVVEDRVLFPSGSGAAPVAADPSVSPRRISLSGAINETVSFVFAFRAGESPIERPALRVAPLTSSSSRIDTATVSIYRMHRVSTPSPPGWHIRSIPPAGRRDRPFDALVPLSAPRGGLPTELRPGETCFFWVDIAIPKGTADGTYGSSIELTSGNGAAAAVGVELTVWPFVLPDTGDVSALAVVDHRALFGHHIRYGGRPVSTAAPDWRDAPTGMEMDALLTSTLRTLQRHRVTPLLPKLVPTVQIDARGSVVIDWTQYDAIAGPILSGALFFNRVGQQHWSMPWLNLDSSKRDRGAPVSGEYAEVLQRYLTMVADHFQSRGWLERSFVQLPGPDRFDVESRRGVSELAGMVRKANERIEIASRLWPQDMEPLGWYGYADLATSGLVDIYMPPAQFFDREVMAEARASGRRTWLGVDRPPYSGSLSVLAPPSYARVLSWQAARLDAETLVVGCVNRWPEPSGRVSPDDCVRLDPGVLLYPGGAFGLTEPVASVRLKRLRDSMQDAAYRSLLDEHGLAHVTEILTNSLAPYAGSGACRTHYADGRRIGWIDDLTPFETARSIMAAEVINASYGGGKTDTRETLARTISWRRLMLTTRNLHLRVEGTRLRPTGTREARGSELECELIVMNRSQRPVSGVIRFASLPEGWVQEDDGQPVPVIGPGESRRVMLRAGTSGVTTSSTGAIDLPIEFATADGGTYRCHATLNCVTAVPLGSGIRIDGDLSDWPWGAVNVAGNFRLIAESANERDDFGTVRPRSATIGFVMRDETSLYVALNCPREPGAPLPASRRNHVEYEDLIPMGEELVELLLDPLNAGTRSPGDLYHIVVKPSGSYLAERGIRLETPCGPWAPWPVGIDVATAVFSDRWTAEIRIPLRSFNTDLISHAIWGFNITRFDLAHQEYSTWSGAKGNAYDPMSLGNIFLP